MIAAYRRVYYGSPASSKADPSVVAVAELLTEMGRRFNDDKALHSAIGQYKFLRREYPGSRDRFEALFTIGQIYQDDLKDQAQAKLAFEEFLHRYPHHHLADEARKALTEPVQQAGLRSKNENDSDDDSSAPKNALGKADSAKSPTAPRRPKAASDRRRGRLERASRRTSPASATGPLRSTPGSPLGWKRDVKFEAQRIDNPERIFFDLLDTNLTSALLGKTFDVDDGLLKKIRVAQFQPGKARIVLEVADRSDYTTFLLTDPPRLIIDIHSKDIHGKDMTVQDKPAARETPLKELPRQDRLPKPRPRLPRHRACGLASHGTGQARRQASCWSRQHGARKIVVEADDDDDQRSHRRQTRSSGDQACGQAPVPLPRLH